MTRQVLNRTVCIALLLLTLLAPTATAALPSSSRELVRRVLVVQGADQQQIADVEASLESAVGRLRAATSSKSPLQGARRVQEFLHHEILVGPYATDGNDLMATVRGGSYNCVTASVLYVVLAAGCGLDVQAMAAPGHVWCRVTGKHQSIDVETTCPTWFDISLPAADLTDAQRTVLALHNERQKVARPLDDRGLVALLYYNRGVNELRRGQFAQATYDNAAALLLDPECHSARANLLATINNWSLSLVSSGDAEAARALLAGGLTLAPEYLPFLAVDRVLARGAVAP